MDMAAEKRKTDEEARKRAAEEKRLRAVEAAEARKREAAEKKAAQEAAKRALKSQETVATAKPRTTISLGFLNFGDSSSAAPSGSAPAGIPTITKWRQNKDGSITGLISGSNAFRNGESVTTSVIKGNASDNTVVQTISGSKYYLSNKPAPVPKKAAPAPSPSQKAQQIKAKEEKRQAALAAAEAKKEAARAAAEARKREAEEKREAARAAAEARQREAEESGRR